ncbi:MAG: hypothetical protein KatS3mg076_3114 [Candidatus Binatia bacterium]|nr:MAG: hypothetical protein KatS3mg076_3114 [Candidatus Binatia bacterium]
MPFQIDERTPDGDWVTEEGAEVLWDSPPRVFDDNDVLLLPAWLGAERLPRKRTLPSPTVLELALHDPLGFPTRWFYVVVDSGSREKGARDTGAFVSYDPIEDRLTGRGVSLGFDGPVPQFLSFDDGPNVLDRLKIRASARFFFGLVPVSRTEDHLVPSPPSWKAGPLRVVRTQRYAIRVGFRIRSPRFVSHVFFYPTYVELPVGARFRVPPSFVFGDIAVRTSLDFRNLRGWWVSTPTGRLPVDCDSESSRTHLEPAVEWFAVEGPDRTLLVRAERSESLARVRQSFFLRATLEREDPENVPGQCPEVGFLFSHWDDVDRGRHEIRAASYLLPRGADLGLFRATVENPLVAEVREMRASQEAAAAASPVSQTMSR